MVAINPTYLVDLESVYDAWRFAADEAADALHAWISGPSASSAASFYAYRAALDREEQAARILAQVSSPSQWTAERSPHRGRRRGSFIT